MKKGEPEDCQQHSVRRLMAHQDNLKFQCAKARGKKTSKQKKRTIGRMPSSSAMQF